MGLVAGAAERLHHIGNRSAIAVIGTNDRRMMSPDDQTRAEIKEREQRCRWNSVERLQRCKRGALAIGQGCLARCGPRLGPRQRSEEHTSELQSLMRISYAVFCLQKKHQNN